MAARITIMAGGTGGHVFPALAVAHELAGRGWQVSWLGTPDSFESRVVPQHGFELDTIAAFRLRGQGLLDRLLAPVRLLRAMWQAQSVLRRRRPQVVLGMGGFVTGPGGLVSRLLGLPLVVHEQNAIPGLTNRWLARIASRVLEAFPGSFAGRPDAIATGNPVRAEIAALPAPAPIDDDRALRLLVIGGSLGAQALNEGVPAAVAMLSADTQPAIRHQAGRDRADATRAVYVGLGVEADVVEFVDDMAAAYQWADLLICRAGALTVSELMAAGRPAVLVPFPFAVDDHQTVNARFLTAADAAVMMPQGDMTAEGLAGLLRELLGDRGRLYRMAQRAYALAKRDATRLVADHCEEVAA
ncbi:MAG: undecaprenyldiphospho-muramoylpentapeptide beta-N-acetylglucosaminyltransferase [Gammaproteobacteria bacterium]|nr:undecaprenyldiphospho-muramoylpentapeptide beta-N-acetylglucosaminyltransferase [Gammaproteobacteria bacterium]